MGLSRIRFEGVYESMLRNIVSARFQIVHVNAVQGNQAQAYS